MSVADELMKAVREERVDRAQALLDASPALDRASLGLDAALMAAARKRNPLLVKALLSSGANPDFADASGQSVLMWACFVGAAECVELMCQAGANVEMGLSQDTKIRPIHLALRSWSTPTVAALLAAGAKASDPDGGCRAREMTLRFLNMGESGGNFILADFSRAALALLERAELSELSGACAKAPGRSL